MKSGVYRDISNEDYHSGPGVSKSLLDLLDQSPVHLRAAMTGAVEHKPMPYQVLGTAFHCLLLEPERFATTYAEPFIAPEGALVTIEDMKAALGESGVPFKASARKADLAALVREHLPRAVLFDDAKATYQAENAGRIELSSDQWQRIHSMREAVMAHRAARKLIAAPGEAELSAYWNERVDTADGRQRRILCRIRPDYWRHDGIMIDVKSAREEGADSQSFARSIATYRYHVQHAMYLEGAIKALRAARGFRQFAMPRAFVFLAVEKDACVIDGVAKGVAVYQLGHESVALGRRLLIENLRKFAECDLTGRWPGYPEEIQQIELPAYAFTQHAAAAA